jgi:uncharacterized protein (DUF433 family)
LSADIVVSKGIVTNPGRFGGRPTIKGTRLLALHVANQLQNARPISVLDNWPFLTYEDISNARGWDRKGRPGELIDDALRWDHEGRPS